MNEQEKLFEEGVEESDFIIVNEAYQAILRITTIDLRPAEMQERGWKSLDGPLASEIVSKLPEAERYEQFPKVQQALKNGVMHKAIGRLAESGHPVYLGREKGKRANCLLTLDPAYEDALELTVIRIASNKRKADLTFEKEQNILTGIGNQKLLVEAMK